MHKAQKELGIVKKHPLEQAKNFLLALSGLSILIVILSFHVLGAQAPIGNAESSPQILGVLELVQDDARTLHYLVPPFSNYYHVGDKVDLRGYVMEVGNWTKPLNSTGNVIVQGPDSEIIFEKRNIATALDNTFDLSLPITSDFKVGKYLAHLESHKKGYVPVDNQYLAPFYLFRNDSYTVTIPNSQDQYSVSVGSIQFESSNMKYDPGSKKLSFDVKRVSGIYAPDGDIGYPGHFLFVVIEQPLISGSLRYQIDNNEPFWGSWLQSGNFDVLQIGADDLRDEGTITIWGYEQ